MDQESGEYYYHNAVTNETVWERPDVGDIIPLTELQVSSGLCSVIFILYIISGSHFKQDFD